MYFSVFLVYFSVVLVCFDHLISHVVLRPLYQLLLHVNMGVLPSPSESEGKRTLLLHFKCILSGFSAFLVYFKCILSVLLVHFKCIFSVF